MFDKKYFYDQTLSLWIEPQNLQFESDGEIQIKYIKDYKDNVIMESDSEEFDQKAKMQKIPIIYNSDESEEGKSGVEEETEKKQYSLRLTVTSWQNVNPNLSEFVCCRDAKTDGEDIIDINISVEKLW